MSVQFLGALGWPFLNRFCLFLFNTPTIRNGTGNALFNMEVAVATLTAVALISEADDEDEETNLDILPIIPLLNSVMYELSPILCPLVINYKSGSNKTLTLFSITNRDFIILFV